MTTTPSNVPVGRIVEIGRAQTGGLVRRELVPPSPAKLRFAHWFLEAKWSLTETAHLFDLEPAALAPAWSARA